MTYVSPDEIKRLTESWLAARWQMMWGVHPEAEMRFIKKARRYYPGVADDLLAQISLEVTEKMVRRNEAEKVTPAYLAQAMYWGLQTYLRRRGGKERQFTEGEMARGIAS